MVGCVDLWNFFDSGSGWVSVMRFTNPPNPIHLYLIYYFNFKNIYYIILLFTFLPLFLNKSQTLIFFHIFCVCLMLCSWLFGHKFSFICGSDVLMLNLIIIVIIVIKKNYPTHRSNPIHVSWVELDPVMHWVWLDFFNPLW